MALYKPIDIHPEWAKRGLSRGLPLYGLVAVTKISSKGKKERRFLAVNEQMLMQLTQDARVKRVARLEDLKEVTLDTDKAWFNLSFADDRDWLMERSDVASNNPRDIGDLVEVIRALRRERTLSNLAVVKGNLSVSQRLQSRGNMSHRMKQLQGTLRAAPEVRRTRAEELTKELDAQHHTLSLEHDDEPWGIVIAKQPDGRASISKVSHAAERAGVLPGVLCAINGQRVDHHLATKKFLQVVQEKHRTMDIRVLPNPLAALGAERREEEREHAAERARMTDELQQRSDEVERLRSTLHETEATMGSRACAESTRAEAAEAAGVALKEELHILKAQVRRLEGDVEDERQRADTLLQPEHLGIPTLSTAVVQEFRNVVRGAEPRSLRQPGAVHAALERIRRGEYSASGEQAAALRRKLRDQERRERQQRLLQAGRGSAAAAAVGHTPRSGAPAAAAPPQRMMGGGSPPAAATAAPSSPSPRPAAPQGTHSPVGLLAAHTATAATASVAPPSPPPAPKPALQDSLRDWYAGRLGVDDTPEDGPLALGGPPDV